MKAADIPVKFPIPFANSAGGSYTRQVPTPSQIGITDGAASLTDGYPPDTFVPESGGGVPPFGQDTNGLLNQISAWSRWQAAGVTLAYDATFSSDIGGYPKGTLLQGTTIGTFWLSLVDDNITNPNASGAGWVALTVGVTPKPYDATYQTAIGGYPKNTVLAVAGTVAAFWVSTTDANMSNPDAGGAGWTKDTTYLQPQVYNAALQSALGGYPINTILAVVGVPGAYWISTTDGNNSNPNTGGADWALITTGTMPKGYSAALSTAIGGYPQGAILTVAGQSGAFWVSTAAANTTNPDAAGAGWVKVTSYLQPQVYSAAYATAIGGYPVGTILASTTARQFWLCTTAANTSNPDSAGAGWVRLTMSLSVASYTGLTGIGGQNYSGGASSKLAQWTVDQIVAVTALTGIPYLGTGLTLNFDGGTGGANGMDTGSFPAAADISIYAIYNPSSNTWATLGCLGSTSHSLVYGGANMPAGYTASVLIHAHRTLATAFQSFNQQDRRVSIHLREVLTNGTSTTGAAIDLSGFIPLIAKRVSGIVIGSNNTATIVFGSASAFHSIGAQELGTINSGSGIEPRFPYDVDIITLQNPQTIYYTVSGSSPSTTIQVSRYWF